MNTRIPLTVSLVLIAVMIVPALWAWHVLPADMQIAVHWGIDGKPNGYAHKTFGVFVIPVLATLVTGLLAVVPRVEPRRLNLAASAKFYTPSGSARCCC
jgi:uncharacterized membrane protein